MAPPYREESWLREQYWEEGLTQREIAEQCGVSPRTIRKYMNEFGIETRDVEGENHPLSGESRDESVREKIADQLEGRDFSPETRQRMAESHRGTDLSEETKRKISEALSGVPKSEETRRRMSESRTGEDNPLWRGGETDRYGPGWTAARRRARERDEVCQRCGDDGSNQSLDVHHIVPVRAFQDDPDVELREAHRLDNLVLLCRSCHMQVEHGNAELERESRDGDE